MLIPIRCFSCGKPIGHLWEEYKERLDKGEDAGKILVNLGADRTARIKADTQNFGVSFGARTIDGSAVTKDRMKYKMTLDDVSTDNCIKEIGRKETEAFFKQALGTNIRFDEYEGDTAFTIIQVDIPDATALCSQKVFIDITDNNEPVGGTTVIIEVVRKGFF